MKIVGYLLLATGILGTLYWLTVDTSVVVFGSEMEIPGIVNQQRTAYMIYGGCFVFGILLVLLSSDSTPKVQRFREYEAEALKAAHKGQNEIAIDNYLDAIYQLKHYYKPFRKKDYEDRKKLIVTFEQKIETLKAGLTANNDTIKQSNKSSIIEN